MENRDEQRREEIEGREKKDEAVRMAADGGWERRQERGYRRKVRVRVRVRVRVCRFWNEAMAQKRKDDPFDFVAA
jgi:hypothetical protein